MKQQQLAQFYVGGFKDNMTVFPKGIIFDMDGVLVNSEPFIIRASTQMFAELGLKVTPEDFHPFTGTDENHFIGGVAEKYNFPLDIRPAEVTNWK